MARVTVEDCIEKIPNRFDLVMTAAQRARDIASGAELSVERDKDKNPVVSLREIAEETVSLEALQESLIKGLQRHVDFDEPETDEISLIEGDVFAAAVAAEGPVAEAEIADDVADVPEDFVMIGDELADATAADGDLADAAAADGDLADDIPATVQFEDISGDEVTDDRD